MWTLYVVAYLLLGEPHYSVRTVTEEECRAAAPYFVREWEASPYRFTVGCTNRATGEVVVMGRR